MLVQGMEQVVEARALDQDAEPQELYLHVAPRELGMGPRELELAEVAWVLVMSASCRQGEEDVESSKALPLSPKLVCCGCAWDRHKAVT